MAAAPYDSILGPWSHAPSLVPASTRECNRRQQVVGVLNEFYVATFLHLYQLWKSQQKTIAESGAVLKGSSTAFRLQGMACQCSHCFSVLSEVELFAKKNPKQMLRRLEVFLKARQASGAPRGASPDPQGQQASPSLAELEAGGGVGQGGQGKELHFTGVCDLPPDMEGEARLI